MENVADYKEIIDVIKESGGEAFKRCFQCGLCDVVCPWNRVRNFSMRKIVRQATFGMTDIENEDISVDDVLNMISENRQDKYLKKNYVSVDSKLVRNGLIEVRISASSSRTDRLG